MTEGSKIIVDRVSAPKGDAITIERVLWMAGDAPAIGKPYLSAKVEATVVEHTKGKKIAVRTYRRRKGYHRHLGHRQAQSALMIKSISH